MTTSKTKTTRSNFDASMNCLLCPAAAVADGLCVQCGAKAWVANARLTNKPERLAALDQTNPLDAERMQARNEIQNIGDALAFELVLITARAKKNREMDKLNKERV